MGFITCQGQRLRRGLTAIIRPAFTKSRVVTLGLALLAALVAVGCSRGTYPFDYFYEMHYQQSYSSHEPPRLSPPESAVPTTGKELPLTPEDVAELTNPLLQDGVRLGVEEGERLFATNCAFCHGDEGRGDGPVLSTMIDKYGYQLKLPPDLTAIGALPDGEIFAIITNRDVVFPGVEGWVMPQFGRLLSAEERWALVNYIRTLQGQ